MVNLFTFSKTRCAISGAFFVLIRFTFSAFNFLSSCSITFTSSSRSPPMVIMAHQTQPCISLVVLLIFTICLGHNLVHGDPEVPCYFIFGDSLVDAGNNNNLATSAKVDYLPYGVDFPEGPTGRFCNGKTTADVFSELLGFDDFIPSFLKAEGSQILKGVNYASGSAGIRAETGKVLGSNIELGKQLQNHQVTISSMVELLGNNVSAMNHLNKCLYSVVIGSNDYINNYFVPEHYNTSRKYTPEQYAEALMEEYSQHIHTLYSYGARKISLTGIGPIGCTPSAIANYDRKGKLCVDEMNEAANLFNHRLQSLVNTLNEDLPDAKFLYLNTYGIVPEYTSSPGFELDMEGCCKVNEFGLCNPEEPICSFRTVHLFFDAFHPTEIANKISVGISYLSLRKIL